MGSLMRVLVTGGAGYIGSVVADRLLQIGHSVTVLDNLSKGKTRAVPSAADFVRADTGDAQILDGIFQAGHFDAVMHFAAFIEAGESMQSPEIYFDNNSAKSLTLLRAVLKHKVPRFVFSSTAAVYGEPRRIPITEDDPLEPTNAYGESKLMVERMLSWFQRCHGLRYASLRYFNAAGGNRDRGENHNPETHLIPLVLQVALGQREAISTYGTDYPTKDGTCGFSVREIIDIARRVTGRDIPAIEAPRRAGDPAVLVASSEKIKRVLGWNPQHSDVEAIVRSAWEWHKSHPKGYEG